MTAEAGTWRKLKEVFSVSGRPTRLPTAVRPLASVRPVGSQGSELLAASYGGIRVAGDSDLLRGRPSWCSRPCVLSRAFGVMHKPKFVGHLVSALGHPPCLCQLIDRGVPRCPLCPLPMVEVPYSCVLLLLLHYWCVPFCLIGGPVPTSVLPLSGW